MSRVTCRHHLRNKKLTSHFKCLMGLRIHSHQSLKVLIKAKIQLMTTVMNLTMRKRLRINLKDSRAVMERLMCLKYKMQCRLLLRNQQSFNSSQWCPRRRTITYSTDRKRQLMMLIITLHLFQLKDWVRVDRNNQINLRETLWFRSKTSNQCLSNRIIIHLHLVITITFLLNNNIQLTTNLDMDSLWPTKVTKIVTALSLPTRGSLMEESIKFWATN